MIVLIGGPNYRECSPTERRQARNAVVKHSLGGTSKINQAALEWAKSSVVISLSGVAIIVFFGLYLLAVQGNTRGVELLIVGVINLAFTGLYLRNLKLFRRIVAPQQ
ncbi:hypothetical protein [Acidithrix ferrooxidans]|uniref:Uncharacterized protein n=1 Tax=Acidithrix ferrooxidans TaxID=1280514 RepID=A0A0D8HL18_9ACTN|nr:hypothetical protein [Acidithrix ferrooxidans]KJF18710.1 hypothetical protein AXFE_03970 [Acidithrix ferrooxidans]